MSPTRATLLGGPHATLLPDEARQHADAVVVGEAERTWPLVIADATAGRLQSLYRDEQPPSLEGLPQARRDLIRGRGLLGNTIIATRGCPHQCSYCNLRLTEKFPRRMFVLPVGSPVPGSGALLDARPAKIHSIRLTMILSTGGSRGEYAALTASIYPSILPADKGRACQILRIPENCRFATSATYIERINLAIDHVVNHLQEPLRLADLSRAAMPIGITLPIDRTQGHLAVWAQRVHGAGVPRRLVPSSGNSSPGSASRCPSTNRVRPTSTPRRLAVPANIPHESEKIYATHLPVL
ncbi:MAG: hypothetical protein ACHRXM_13065 [Isosphaerales bacterium]